MSECLLRKTNGLPAVDCEEARCVFWRLVEQAEVSAVPESGGCAIQYFELLEGGEPVAAWLLSVKERLEGVATETIPLASPTDVLDPRD